MVFKKVKRRRETVRDDFVINFLGGEVPSGGGRNEVFQKENN